MNKPPYLSIILSTYNGQEYLAQCLDSILNQSFQNFEIIVIDDGSTDGTLSILKDYSSRYPRIICYFYPHNGTTKYLNEAIKLTKGELIFQIDQDDYIAPNFLENLIKPFSDDEIDCVSCSYTYVNDNAEVIDWYTPILKGISIKLGHEAAKMFLTSLHQIQGFRWNKVTRRSIFIDNNLHYPVDYPPDLIFKIEELDACNKVVFLDEKGYFYRQHSSSDLATINIKKRIAFIKAYDIIRNKAKKLKLNVEGEYFYLYHVIKLAFELIKRNKSNSKDLKQYFKEISFWDFSFIKGALTICKYKSSISRLKMLLKYIIVYALTRF